MKAHVSRILKYAVINLFLVSLIAGIYVLASNEDVREVLNSTAGFPVYHGSQQWKKAALECCVDGSEKRVIQILDIMKENRAALTFYVSAPFARANPDILRRMSDEGHEIGMLGRDYQYGLDSADEIIRDIKYFQSIVLDAAGVRPLLYMPYSDSVEGDIVGTVASFGCKAVLFTRNSFSLSDTPSEILHRAVKGLGNGDLIMLYPTAGTIEALPRIIYELRRQGLDMETAGRLIGY